MTVFEHSFSLIGLVLGFALVEVLSALVRTMKERGTARIGWLTPLLAVFVLLDVATFWGIVYGDREILPSLWPTLGVGLVLSSTYYAAASMVFPSNDSEWPDLDEYFMCHRKIVLGLMFIVYMLTLTAEYYMGHALSNLANRYNIAYLVLLLFTAFVPYRKACAVGLCGLITVDTLVFLW